MRNLKLLVADSLQKNLNRNIQIVQKNKKVEIVGVTNNGEQVCDWSKHCDETICVVANHDLRLERLTKRLQDKAIYNEGDRSFWSYKERNN